jgi:hypothetical protein
MKGLINFRKLAHHIHHTPPHGTPNYNNIEEFFTISQRVSEWVLKVCTNEALEIMIAVEF